MGDRMAGLLFDIFVAVAAFLYHEGDEMVISEVANGFMLRLHCFTPHFSSSLPIFLC